MNYQKILEEIRQETHPLISKGTVASYIPKLGEVKQDKFGLAVQTLDGQLFTVGDADEPFSIQSISKVFTLTLAFGYIGDTIWQRLDREPSGTPFNSLVQLEYENGIPRNPFINAGALVVADIILSHADKPRETLLSFVKEQANNPKLSDDPDVASSEKTSAFRNAALANLLKSFSNLENDVNEILDYYFFQCSLSMTCVELARSFLYLSNHGVCPWTDRRIMTKSQSKRMNALMLTCGTYDAVGDFAYRVGLPGKSGVGGGIVAIIPDLLSVAVWSPGLNKKGNSLAGTKALELFTTKTGRSIF